MIDAGADGQDWEEPAEELDDIFIGDADLWYARLPFHTAITSKNKLPNSLGPFPH